MDTTQLLQRVIAVVLGDGPTVIQNAHVRLEGPTPGVYYEGDTNGDGYLALWVAASLGASQLTVTKPGYYDASFHVDLITLPQVKNQTIRLGGPEKDPTDILLPPLQPARRALPPPPSRDDVLDYRNTFQGLQYQTEAYGSIPAGFLALLSPVDRQHAYLAHDEAHDLHLIVDLSSAYKEPGTLWPEALTNGKDWTSDLPGLKAIVREMICEFFCVELRLACDGLSPNDDPDGGYNDPVGLTYGWQWGMEHVPGVLKAFRGDADSACPDGEDLTPYMVFNPGYDGCFYGWSREHEAPDPQPGRVRAFFAMMRAVLPLGVFALEHTPGNIPTGGGPDDFLPGGTMEDVDILQGEYQNGLPRNATDYNPNTNPGCSLWMVVDRMVRPWTRPPDMPKTGIAFYDDGRDKWDPAPPMYLVDSARGRRVYVALEWDRYRDVRGQVSPADIAANRQYLKDMGVTYTG